MDYEIKDCIDAGTEYCPCHLAETGDCILCSQLSGKTFCDCINWKGVCIYQEYIQNGNKPNSIRESYKCKIIKKEIPEKNLLIYTLNAPHSLVCSLTHPGSFVFVRDPKTMEHYDTPISIMEADTEENSLKIAIEKRGVKTKTICELNQEDELSIRAPFWNGVLGLKDIYNAKGGTSLVICRGIGIAPGIPVIRKLYSNGNKIITILDSSPFKSVFGIEYLNMFKSDVYNCKTLLQGSLTEELKKLIISILHTENINHIHCDGPDILIYEILNFVDDSIKFSCCNNSKMCCGEGICGTCITRYRKDIVKRLCKTQVNPRYIFKDRRLI